jgi:hypothetical protein
MILYYFKFLTEMSIAVENLPRPLKKEAAAPRWFIKISCRPAAATILSKTYRDRAATAMTFQKPVAVAAAPPWKSLILEHFSRRIKES